MDNIEDLVNAIDRLTTAINQPSNTFLEESLSIVLTTIGSIVAVLVFELIKNNWITPREEFKKLQRRVNTTLSMYAEYYANPTKYEDYEKNQRIIDNYINSSVEVRRIAVDVLSFAEERRSKRICGICVNNIHEAGSLLIGLSNSFFHSKSKENIEQADRIKLLLGIENKKQ